MRKPPMSKGTDPPHLDLAQSRRGLPGSDPKRLGQFNVAAAQGDALAGGGGIYHFFLVNPGLDPAFGDSQPDAVPLAVLEIQHLRGFVFGSIQAIEAGDADHRSAPTAHNEAAERIVHWHSQAAEKIRA